MNLSGQEAASIAHKMLEANHERLKLEEKRIAEEHERIQVENKRADTERVRNYLIAAVALAALAVVHKRSESASTEAVARFVAWLLLHAHFPPFSCCASRRFHRCS